MSRNPIVNGPGYTAYYTASGEPYTTVTTDLSVLDKTKQPKENVVFVTGNTGSSQTIIGENGTGSEVNVVKVTNTSKYIGREIRDINQFIVWGSNQKLGNMRLNGSYKYKDPDQLKQAFSSEATWELKDPKNPYSQVVKSQKAIYTFYPEVNDYIVVKNQGNKFTASNDDGRGDFYEGEVVPVITDVRLYSIEVQKNFLTIILKAILQGSTGTVSVDWGDGSNDDGISGGSNISHNYAQSGSYDVTVAMTDDPKEKHTIKVFVAASDYEPTPAKIDSAEFTTEDTTVTGVITVTGTPEVVIDIDWYDGSGLPEETERFYPDTVVGEVSTFNVTHTYNPNMSGGGTPVMIYTENFFDNIKHQDKMRKVVTI